MQIEVGNRRLSPCWRPIARKLQHLLMGSLPEPIWPADFSSETSQSGRSVGRQRSNGRSGDAGYIEDANHLA
jgi:hypothetical protein